ncbi:MAG: ferritin-like domain-containing protein [Rhizobiales bacterium]|nr:ferritin-like domain-containing protein [Hyphomicrobiales bacterium]
MDEQMARMIAMGSRQRLSRRRLVGRTAGLAGGSALLLSLGVTPWHARAQDDSTPEAAAGSEPAFDDPLDVLNYALTLEHLENAFYRDGVDLFDLGTDGFGFNVNEQLTAIGAHEAAHVAALTDTIVSLGGEPVAEASYLFDDAYADADAFLMTAAALENTGVSAYDGAASSIEDPMLLTVAGGIVAVEARHASYLNLITGEVPFPASFEMPLTPDEVLEIAGPFLA